VRVLVLVWWIVGRGVLGAFDSIANGIPFLTLDAGLSCKLLILVSLYKKLPTHYHYYYYTNTIPITSHYNFLTHPKSQPQP